MRPFRLYIRCFEIRDEHGAKTFGVHVYSYLYTFQKILGANADYKNNQKLPENSFFQRDVHVKVILMMKTKIISKGKCFGCPVRQQASLVFFRN